MKLKKIIDYNSPQNIHKRLMEFSVFQKIILLGILGVFNQFQIEDGFKEMWWVALVIFAIYLFQSKK
tara:strand:+ start:855 stop:1055 length:201 start_codon:yes stop_codon:yes gene_type:complete